MIFWVFLLITDGSMMVIGGLGASTAGGMCISCRGGANFVQGGASTAGGISCRGGEYNAGVAFIK